MVNFSMGHNGATYVGQNTTGGTDIDGVSKKGRV